MTELLLRGGIFDAWPLLRAAIRGDAAAAQELEAGDLKSTIDKLVVRAPPPANLDTWFLANRPDAVTKSA